MTALGKMILLLLMVMGGVCYCAGLNGGPNYVMHYSVERVCRISVGLKRAFSKACSLIDAFLAPRSELFERKTPLSPTFEGRPAD